VLQSLSHQLAIYTLGGLQSYRKGEQREEHVTKIRKRYGYGDITEPRVGFRMTRWLYGVCWTGTERLGALFEKLTLAAGRGGRKIVGAVWTLYPSHEFVDEIIRGNEQMSENKQLDQAQADSRGDPGTPDLWDSTSREK
jgi:hypothetical protein